MVSYTLRPSYDMEVDSVYAVSSCLYESLSMSRRIVEEEDCHASSPTLTYCKKDVEVPTTITSHNQL